MRRTNRQMVYLSKIYKLSLEMFLRGDPSSARLLSVRPPLLFLFPVSLRERKHAAEFVYENYKTVKHILPFLYVLEVPIVSCGASDVGARGSGGADVGL